MAPRIDPLVQALEDRVKVLTARQLQAARELNYVTANLALTQRSLRSAKAAHTTRTRRSKAAA
jgi:hypothetical protein